MVYKVKTIKKKRTKKNRRRVCTYKKKRKEDSKNKASFFSDVRVVLYTKQQPIFRQIRLNGGTVTLSEKQKDTLIGNDNNSGDADQQRGQMKGKEKETIKQNSNNKNRKGGKKRKPKSLK